VTTAIGPPVIDDAYLAVDGRYRYWLTRSCGTPWTGSTVRYVNFIGLNPSTADATRDDPTVRRLRGFAKSWGYDGFWLTNLFAFRATDPADLCFHQGDIDGPENTRWLEEVAARAGLVVAAWGAVDGLFRNNVRFAERRATGLINLILSEVDVHVLGITKRGFPRHPLYVKSDTQPVLWRRGRRWASASH